MLGVSGSIAAYKAVDVVSALVQHGVDVRVIMTMRGGKVCHALVVREHHEPSGIARPLVGATWT